MPTTTPRRRSARRPAWTAKRWPDTRWARRRRALVVGAAATVLVGAAALGVVAVHSERARRALAAERDATEAQRRRAEAARRRTREALDAMTSRAAADWLATQPGLGP